MDNLSIRADNESVEVDASDIYPSFVLLVDALHILHTYQGETTVTWTCEPTEYDLHFQRVGEIITLSVSIHSDSSRTVWRQDPTLTVSGSYDEICLPFWRAMRQLQARFTPIELEERWTNTFPHHELHNLTALLGKHPKTKIQEGAASSAATHRI